MKTVKLNLGNGDLIALAGAIRLATKRYGALRVPTLADNLANARALFASEPLVKPFVVGSLAQVLVSKGLRFYEPVIPRDIDRDHYAHIYDMLGLDYSARWNASPIPASRELVPMITPPRWPYRFVHDDPERGFIIKRFASNSVSVFRPSPYVAPLLSWSLVIENAEEIDVMDSSLFHLTEHLNPKTKKLRLHRYPRPYTPVWMDYQTRHDWTIVE